MPNLALKRCAVYTRKSSEEGLEQDFNSLHAQREACEAYIRSQAGEGWRLVPDAFDDGGISGGTMERPALRRLMGDIESGKIDVVVVYKVDRLTRSLSDFSKMVEVFDRQGVSFVAVTQQFNTTTSMGRLTLNVLLSFAQFEREVTGERIRDKLAASKRKGIWMGGGLPRGYRVEDRKLIVIPEQAETVRQIFQEYLKCDSIRDLALTLRRRGITALSRTGNPEAAGKTISRGALHTLLRNPIYIGLIPHKKERFPGQHEAILDPIIWEAVQAKLKNNALCRGRPKRKTEPSPLMGKLVDEIGRCLTPSHANKRGRRYRYYETHSDDRDADRHAGLTNRSWRLPAAEIEGRVGEVVESMLSNRAEIGAECLAAGWDSNQVETLLECISGSGKAERMRWVHQVQLGGDHLRVAVSLPGQNPLSKEKTVAMALKRRGIERKVVIPGKADRIGQQDRQMMKALSLGLRFWEQLNSDHVITAQDFARRERIDNRYIGRAMRLAFLAPDIVEAFVEGRQPVDWTAERLLRWDPLPLSWQEQRRVLGMA